MLTKVATDGIREDDEEPGIRPYEASLLRLVRERNEGAVFWLLF